MSTLTTGLLIGLVSGFVGSIAGGGGLVSTPLLILSGLNAKVSLGTNKLGGIGLSIGALVKYYKEKKIRWKEQKIFIPLSIIAGFIGSNLLVNSGLEFIRIFTSIAIIILAPLVLINKNFGLNEAETTIIRKIIGTIIYFLLLAFGSFFGPGTGPLIYTCLIYFFGFSIIKAVASNFVPWLFSSLISLIVFINAGIVNFEIGIPLTIGMFIGGYFGAKMAVLKGNLFVKVILALVCIISAVRIIFS